MFHVLPYCPWGGLSLPSSPVLAAQSPEPLLHVGAKYQLPLLCIFSEVSRGSCCWSRQDPGPLSWSTAVISKDSFLR